MLPVLPGRERIFDVSEGVICNCPLPIAFVIVEYLQVFEYILWVTGVPILKALCRYSMAAKIRGLVSGRGKPSSSSMMPAISPLPVISLVSISPRYVLFV